MYSRVGRGLDRDTQSVYTSDVIMLIVERRERFLTLVVAFIIITTSRRAVLSQV